MRRPLTRPNAEDVAIRTKKGSPAGKGEVEEATAKVEAAKLQHAEAESSKGNQSKEAKANYCQKWQSGERR
jgi:hypothetical protein